MHFSRRVFRYESRAGMHETHSVRCCAVWAVRANSALVVLCVCQLQAWVWTTHPRSQVAAWAAAIPVHFGVHHLRAAHNRPSRHNTLRGHGGKYWPKHQRSTFVTLRRQAWQRQQHAAACMGAPGRPPVTGHTARLHQRGPQRRARGCWRPACARPSILAALGRHGGGSASPTERRREHCAARGRGCVSPSRQCHCPASRDSSSLTWRQ